MEFEEEIVYELSEQSSATGGEDYEQELAHMSEIAPGDEVDDRHDPYCLDLTVAIAETVETADSVEVAEEFEEALEEIEGKKSFPCSKCEKICKSKGGLTRHVNSKHQDAVVGEGEGTEACSSHTHSFSLEILSGIVETIKTNVIQEDIYGTEINTSIKTVSCSEALFNAVLPMYERFSRKKDQDRLLESFYGLFPNSCKLLNCQDFRAANLIMIHLPDHLVGFHNVRQVAGKEASTTHVDVQPAAQSQIGPAERGPMSYIAGYVLSKLHQTSKRKAGNQNIELQALLQSMKSSHETSNSFISARSRGGLVTPCEELVGILEITELCFRKEVDQKSQTVRNIPTEIIYNSTIDSPQVKSLWDSIVLASSVEASSLTSKLCLENIIKLYVRVRSFSFAKDYITKYKIKAKQIKKKSLRKEMKKGSKDDK
jgi:hypothetical protein